MPTGKPFDFFTPGEEPGYFKERMMMVLVVRVKPRHYFTIGAAETIVNGLVLTTIRLALPVGQVFLVLPDNRNRIVSAA